MTSDDRTQPEPDSLARAGDILEAILAGDLSFEERLAVGAALTTLYDVDPPYPPRPESATPLDLIEGLPQALRALSEPLDSVQDTIRAGLAARELRALRGQP